VRFRKISSPLPISITAILDFDHARSGAPSQRFSTHIRPKTLAHYSEDTTADCDITLDLSSAETIERSKGAVVRPLYNGSPKDYALFHALLDRRAPHLTLWHSERALTSNIGLPALDDPHLFATSFEQISSRLIEGLLRFFSNSPGALADAGPAPTTIEAGTSESTLAYAGEFLSARLMRKVRRMTDAFSGDAPRCHVAWRHATRDDTLQPGTLNLADFRIVADDGAHTYASPNIVTRSNRAHLFLTEIAETTGIGRLTHTLLGGDELIKPAPVNLPEDTITFPYIFEHAGETWMLSGAPDAGINLHRCTQFPGAWQLVSQVIDAPAHSLTFFEHDGLLWIATGCSTLQSSVSDGLALYSAKDIGGPWQPHQLNPVIVDAACARPGGTLWRHDERLYRPAQDCSKGIGSALTLRSVAQLNRDTFAEQTLGTLAFDQRLHLDGPHIVSRGGGFEAIELVARPSALRLAFRAGYRAPIAL